MPPVDDDTSSELSSGKEGLAGADSASSDIGPVDLCPDFFLDLDPLSVWSTSDSSPDATGELEREAVVPLPRRPLLTPTTPPAPSVSLTRLSRLFSTVSDADADVSLEASVDPLLSLTFRLRCLVAL